MNRSIGRALVGVSALALIAGACRSTSSDETASSPAASAPSPTGANSPTNGDCEELADLSGNVEDHGTAALSGASVEIDAGDFFFDATCLTASSPGEIMVTVTNTGSALHNFSVADQGIDEDVPVGGSITVTVELPSSGSLPFLCKYHVGAGMQGAFVVG